MLLAQALRQKIESGQYLPGSLLPTELVLQQQFGLSRITVRAALRELETLGLVSRRAGVGTRVESARPASVFQHAGSSIDDVLQFTRGLPFHVLSVDELVVGGALAAEMELPPGQRFVKVRGLRQGKGALPIMVSEHYIPGLHAAVVPAFEGHAASIAELVAQRQGTAVEQIRQQVSAVKLSAAAARTLQATPGSACLRTRRWYLDSDGVLIMAATSLFPADRFVFTSTLRRRPAS